MTALDAVEWEACVLEPVRDPATEAFLRRTYGRLVPPAMRYFAGAPWLLRSVVALELDALPLLHAPDALAHMIALVVSQDSSCRYCYTATRSIMRILGYPEARIRRLEEDVASADLAPRERAALVFARRVSRATPLAGGGGGDVRTLLEAGWSAEAIREIAMLAAISVYFNRISTLPALPPAEVDLADRWVVRLLRPLLARRFRPRRVRAVPPLAPAEREGPFASLINAYDGLPGAPRLRAIVDDLWRSTTLPRRTVALMCAVVARGLGCDVSEAEARRLLAGEGLEPDAIAHALAHLSGPGLDALDTAAAALARESIWYRPAHIQRQVQALRAACAPAQLLDIIGVASFANLLCRLGIALDDAAPPRATATA